MRPYNLKERKAGLKFKGGRGLTQCLINRVDWWWPFLDYIYLLERRVLVKEISFLYTMMFP